MIILAIGIFFGRCLAIPLTSLRKLWAKKDHVALIKALMTFCAKMLGSVAITQLKTRCRLFKSMSATCFHVIVVECGWLLSRLTAATGGEENEKARCTPVDDSNNDLQANVV